MSQWEYKVWINGSQAFYLTLSCLGLVWLGLPCHRLCIQFCVCIVLYKYISVLSEIAASLIIIGIYSVGIFLLRSAKENATNEKDALLHFRTGTTNGISKYARAYRTNSLTTNLLHWIAGKNELCAGGTSETVWCFSFSILFCFTTQMERILNSVPINFLSFSYEGAVHQMCLYVLF